MPEALPAGMIRCPKCGTMSTGNYCSNCGASLVIKKESEPFLEFAKDFLNLGNIWNYIKLYVSLVPDPVSNTISIYKTISFEAAVKFIEYSVAIYSLCTAGNFIFRQLTHHLTSSFLWEEVLQEVFYLMYVIAGYYILLRLFYRFASKRYGKQDKKEYIKMYCLYAGLLLPINGIILYVFAGSSVFIQVFKFILSFSFACFALFFGYRIWSYFWKAPGNKVVVLLMVAALISFTVCFLFIIIVFALLNIDLPSW